MWESLLRLDGNILLFIQDMIRNPFLDPVMKIITTLGNAGILWIMATILLLIPKQTRKVGIFSACALLASLLVNNILIKNLVGRVRPYYAVEGLIPIVTKPSEFSFPSGHAASSFASASVFYRKLPKKYGVLAVVMAGLIALSRLYVGVHYPTDVLAGIISGIGCGYLGERAVTGLQAQKKGMLSHPSE
ncbi:MAG: phosphatase PAP2 family protein [Acetatifactor sp.]|nr:phosphatase PAP2 family protein [Acetatifactor sp.]